MAVVRSPDVYRRVWTAFERSDATADGRHDTPHWRAHVGPFAACAVRVPTGSMEPDFDVLRHDLASVPGIRLHPNHFLHIMVQELGFVVENPARPDEFSAARLEEFAQAATDPISSAAPFPIMLGGANSFQDAVFLDIRGGEALTRIHSRLFDLAALPRVADYPYLPHCTIAHYDGTVSPRDAVAILTPWRERVLGGFTVAELEIITMAPSEPYPALESYAVIPLGG